MQEQTWEKIIAELVVGILCGCVVLLVLLVVVVLMVKWVVTTVQTYPYSNCTFHHQNAQRVQTSFTLPTNLGKTLANIIHRTCFFQHVCKPEQDPCKNKHGENCIVQVVCWYSVWLPGAAGVGGEVSEETIRTYLYSNCTFLHQI